MVSLAASKVKRVMTKSRQLCEILQNLTIYDASLSIGTPPLHLTIAIVLEARRKC